MSESRQPPQDEAEGIRNTITRREMLKRTFGLGLAAATGALFRPESVAAFSSPQNESSSCLAISDQTSSDDTDNYIYDLLVADDETALDDQHVILENFQEYTPESMVEAVRANINTFLKVPAENLTNLGSKSKTDITLPGYGSVDTPVIDPETENPNGHKQYFIAKDDTPGEFFPSVGLSYRTAQEGEYGFQNTLYMQGIYLGRTEHGFASENAGDVIVDVGYFGQYYGEAEDMLRLIMPVFLGWKTLDKLISNNSISLVRPLDSGKYTAPLSISGGFDTEVNVVKSFDENVGNSVAELHIGNYDGPSADWSSMAAELGWPREFYELEYLLEESETTGDVANAIQTITSAKALEAGYSLISIVDLKPIPTPIPELYPKIEAVDPKVEVKKIISYKKLLNMNEISLKETVRLPRFVEGVISPASKTIAQE